MRADIGEEEKMARVGGVFEEWMEMKCLSFLCAKTVNLGCDLFFGPGGSGFLCLHIIFDLY